MISLWLRDLEASDYLSKQFSPNSLSLKQYIKEEASHGPWELPTYSLSLKNWADSEYCFTKLDETTSQQLA
jgi:hypothetical protein